MSWLAESPIDRQKDMSSVMNCVRFANIDPYYFHDKVERSAMLRGCDGLNQLFDTVRCYHMLPNRRAEVLMLID